MATLTVQQPKARASIQPSYGAAAAGGDDLVNDGKTYLHVKNASAGSITVTVNSQTPCNQGSDHDDIQAVGAGAERIMGPFPKSQFDDSNGKVLVTYSGVTSLTVAVVSIV